MARHFSYWLTHVPHRMALVALALLSLSACVVTQSPEPTTPPPPEHAYPPEADHPSEPAPYPSAPYRNEGPYARRPMPQHPGHGQPQHPPHTQPHHPPHTQPQHPGHGQPPAVDCSQRPAYPCCKALTPECNACVERARAAQAQWDRECASAGPVQPAPAPPVDCSQPPGLMCCEANTAECNACRSRAAAERAAWARECRAGAPPSQPSPPSQPVIDCSQPPGRMCCQAETAACHSCKRQAAAERAAWERQCL